MDEQGQATVEPHTAREIQDMQAENLDILEGWTMKELREEYEKWDLPRLERHWNLMKPMLPWLATVARNSFRYDRLTRKITLISIIISERKEKAE